MKKPLYMTLGATMFDAKTVQRDELLDHILFWIDQMSEPETSIIQRTLFQYAIGSAMQIAELRSFETFTDEELSITFDPFG